VPWYQRLTKERKWKSLTKVFSGFEREQKGQVHQPPCRVELEFPTICDTVHELGLGYVFAKPKKCNLTSSEGFYEN
ncbi:hypothetical protein HAX54_000495, partial [Datura stramonium]|nr:hypothetical protein [Datura stramonium]